MLPKALQLMSDWGFVYQSNAVVAWKPRSGGCWFREQHTLVLVGTKGEFSPPSANKLGGSVITSRRAKKPSAIYERIRAAFPDLVCLEMHGSGPREGWLVPGEGS
jgi:N6-adenosine-specific RNA methylase IME4